MNTSRSLIALALIGFSFSAYGAYSYSLLPASYTPQLRIGGHATVESYGHYSTTNDQIHDSENQYLGNAGKSNRLSVSVSSTDPVLLSNSTSGTGAMGIGWMHATSGASATTEPPLGVLAKHTKASAASGLSMAMSDTLVIRSASLADGQQGIIHAKVAIKTANAGGTYGPGIGTAAHEGYGGEATLAIESYDWVEGSAGMPLVHKRTADVLRYESYLQGNTGYQEMSWVTYETRNQPDPTEAYGGYKRFGQQGQVSGWMSIDIDIPFTFGKAFGIDMYGDADFGAWAEVPSLSPDDPANSFARRADGALTFDMRWDGIASIDAIGTGLSTQSGGSSSRAFASLGANDYSIEALSGADYMHAMAPVPEPETWAMLFAGLGLIGFIRRSQGRNQAPRLT